jgi:hypothetical protein
VLNSAGTGVLQEVEDEYGLGLALGYCRRLNLCHDNAPVIVNYLKALGNEINVSSNYKRLNLNSFSFTTVTNYILILIVLNFKLPVVIGNMQNIQN